MFTCTIGLFGLPSEIISENEVEIGLPDNAALTDVVAALRHKNPALVGTVICSSQEQLADFFVFNINGRFYFDDKDIRIRKGDHVSILAAATGG